MAAASRARRTIPAAKMRWTKDRQSWKMTRRARPILKAAAMNGRIEKKFISKS